MSSPSPDPRQLALNALRAIQRGAYADVALDRVLRQTSLEAVDGLRPAESNRRLVTELVYGSVRRQRTLDALIDRLAKKKSHQQPPDLRLILHLGLYQLRYLNHIPASAAVDTTVELTKQNGFKGLSGFVNGVLRNYGRQIAPGESPIQWDTIDRITQLAIEQSYPDWMVELWVEQFGWEDAEKLCIWLNQPPHIDLRVNPLKATVTQVEQAMQAAGVAVMRIVGLPQALRLEKGVGAIDRLPGFAEGWWTVQDSSAQLVSHLLDPQPGEVVIDACAAPGGKTTHLAELMRDQGTVWGCDRYASRLKKLKANAERLQLHSIQICTGDSRDLPQFKNTVDRVLIDAPCSGLGTLHRHADARWRQTPETVRELAQLQTELLNQAATWVKPNGVMVYATCTLHPAENEAVIDRFLAEHPEWQIKPIPSENPAARFVSSPSDEAHPAQNWLKVLPHQHDMDGFFMVLLGKAIG
jgi:16S rRNA (cytosine967-C5)-methyltransferase